MAENRTSEHSNGYQFRSHSVAADKDRASAVGSAPARRLCQRQVSRSFLWLFAVVVLTATMAHATNYTGNISISPASPIASWPTNGSQSLNPQESATLAITIVQSGYANGYLYQRWGDVTTDWMTNNLNFIWSQTPAGAGGGTFSICNTASTSAWASVIVKCVWKPVLSGGGGGPGWVPPDINGIASGSAISQPGDYYNRADNNIIRIGETTVAKAYCDGELSESTWSAAGDKLRFVTGGGEETSVSGEDTVTVKGKQAGDDEMDASISSTCECGCGKTDTESFTVVAVKSLTATPNIVPLNFANIFYTITTQPTGHNDLVTLTPADTSTPGSNAAVAVCGNSVTAIVTVLKVDINKVLSDQFSGADENRLPPIGTYPDKNKPMLMGCSAGTTAKVKVEATVDPAAAANHAYVGVRKQGTTAILNSHVINSGGQTPLTWDSSTGDAVYEIVAGVDVDGSTTLDPGEVCGTFTYPDGVRVFNQGEYTSCANYLSVVVLGGQLLQLSTASTLLSWFLGNTGNDTTVSVTDPYLYHPVGVEWSGATGPCSKYNFANLDKVVRATEFRGRLVSQAITDHYAEMLTYFSAHPGDTHTFDPWSCTFSSFTFPDPGTYIGIDADMYYAFAQVNGFTVTSYQLTMHDSGGLNYDVLSITAAGYFYDLYDFDITAGGFSIPAAKVQAGYPTLGTSGRVFKDDRVNFNGTWVP